MAVSDEDNIQAYHATRSETAFTAIVQKHGGMVFGAALRRIGDRQTAEEICQNVFAILSRKAATLTKPGSLAGWLHRTTMLETNNFMKQQRRRQRKHEALSEAAPSPPAWQHDGSQDALTQLDEAVDQLAASDRRVIMLRYFEGLTVREIAQATGKSEAASQKKLQRAIGKLSQMLGKRGVAASSGALLTQAFSDVSAAMPAAMAAEVSHAALALGPSITGTQLISNTVLNMMTTSSLVGIAATTAIVTVTIPLTLMSQGPARPAPATAATAGTPLDHNIAITLAGNMHAHAPVNGVIRGSGPELGWDAVLGSQEIQGFKVPVLGTFKFKVAQGPEGYRIQYELVAQEPVEVPSETGAARNNVRFNDRTAKSEVVCKSGETKEVFRSGEHVVSLKVDKLSLAAARAVAADKDVVIRLSGSIAGGVPVQLSTALTESLGDVDLGKRDGHPIAGTFEHSLKKAASGYQISYAFGAAVPFVEEGAGTNYASIMSEGTVLCQAGKPVEILKSGKDSLTITVETADP